MNAELREAVERVRKWLLRPPAALRSIYRGNARKSYADEARELAESLEAVTQALRDQEAEVAELRREMDDYNTVESALEDAIAAQNRQRERAEKAEALLRECRQMLPDYCEKLVARITAHLGGENNG